MSTALAHQVLQDETGKRLCLLGNVAIARGALEAGLQFFSCYPGTPSSEVGDTIGQIARQAGITFEYSVNEKIAVEIAFAACLTGARAMCSMKHLGLNYANDPISSMPYVGVEGGLVIVSAGDPSAITSPNEQDQRHFSRFLYYPMFDPATPEDGLIMTRHAFQLSEETRLPVIMRPTTRVCHSSGMVTLGPLPNQKNTIGFTKNPQRYVPIPSNARRMRKELTQRYRHARQLLATSDFFPRVGSGRYGIVASGVAYAYTRQLVDDWGLHDEVTLQKIGAYPIPDEVLSALFAGVDSVLVVEELTPFVEEWLSAWAFRNLEQIPILGKHSDHFPVEYEYTLEKVGDALRLYLQKDRHTTATVRVPELPDRPPVLCPGCSHRTSFYLARRAFGKSTVYCNDIGCYTLGYGEPLNACDTVLCMGSSISQASGIARMTKQRVVAYIGDSTFFHSGIPALLNAVAANDNITVVILDNHVAAMTGFQPSLTTPEPAANDGEQPQRFSIEALVRGLGVDQVCTVDPFDEPRTLSAFRNAKDHAGVNVVICQAPCVVNERRQHRAERRSPFQVNQELCNACSLCVRLLGCPAILIVDGEYVIDQDLCDGCEVCAELCNHDAIQRVE